jgi:hypothetical protein
LNFTQGFFFIGLDKDLNKELHLFVFPVLQFESIFTELFEVILDLVT